MALPVTLVFVMRSTRDLAPASKGFRDVACSIPATWRSLAARRPPTERGEKWRLTLLAVVLESAMEHFEATRFPFLAGFGLGFH